MTTRLLFEAVYGNVISCLGPLGRPFETVSPPAEAWMVAGGVGLAPFATLTEALREPRDHDRCSTARAQGRAFYLDWFSSEACASCSAPRTALSVNEDGSQVLSSRRSGMPTAKSRFTRAALSGCSKQSHTSREHKRPAQVSVERVMGCGMGGCYSCVIAVGESGGGHHYVRSCLAGPVFTAADLVWDE